MIAIPYNTKLIEKNEKQYGMNDGSHCIICNKPVDMVGKNTAFVRIIAATAIGTPTEAEADPDADMGLYPIGPDCLRRHPELKPYVMTEEQDAK